MNILIASAGTRNKVVEAFKKTLDGRGIVAAADLSPMAPALYAADKAFLVPRIDAPDYIPRLLEICRQEHIDGVFSLIDPELSLLARERARFEAVGTKVIVSSYELCELSLDKYRMYSFLKEQGIPTARCWISLGDFDRDLAEGKAAFPVFVKPRCGSASIHIQRVEDRQELGMLVDREPDLMIQELMTGQEYGCDAYIDLISGRCTGIFLKKKIRMRAGETDKSVSVHDEALFALVAEFAEKAGYRGMIDLDFFLQEGKWYLSEVNPRFGGGYPHAYACGVDFPAMILENLAGRENPVRIGDYEDGVYMMKYNELAIVREGELIS